MGKNAATIANQPRFSIRSLTVRCMAAILVTGCALQERNPGRTIAAPSGSLTLRAPAIGQQWVYQVRDLYSDRIVDRLTETVATVFPEVRIERLSQKWGPLPAEIQQPSGYFAQDVQWGDPLTFPDPLPAWPQSMTANSWSGQYTYAGSPDFRYSWSQSMRPLGWESLTLAAGSFDVLHYTVLVHYQGPQSYYYSSSERSDSVWLAPQVGRWVLRRSRSVKYGSGHGGIDLGDATEWELVSWR